MDLHIHKYSTNNTNTHLKHATFIDHTGGQLPKAAGPLFRPFHLYVLHINKKHVCIVSVTSVYTPNRRQQHVICKIQ